MKKMLCLLSVAVFGLGGCATCYKMSAPRGLAKTGLINDPAQVSKIEKTITDSGISNLLDADVRAKLPTGVAVAKIGEYSGLETLETKELQRWDDVICAQAHITGVHPISDAMLMGRHSITLQSLRTSAAGMNCELLMVYTRSDSAVDNFNDAAALYWTFVGLWLVPGNVIEHRTVMQAILVDCRTGMILGTATGDARDKRLCPAAFADIRKDELAEKVPQKALTDLEKGVGKLMKQIVESAVAKAE